MRTRASQRLDQPLTANDVPASGVFWTRGELEGWLNEACQQVWSAIVESGGAAAQITETEGMYTASTRRVSLQTLLGITDDPLEITGVRDITNVAAPGQGATLDYMPQGLFLEYANRTESALARRTGIRRAWTWSGSNPMRIELFPVPTTALTLRVRYIPAAPATLTLDADVPSWLPTAHHPLLILYAVVQAKQKEGSDWRQEWTLYQEKLEAVLTSVQDRQQQSSRSTYVTDPSEYGWPL